jgi:predicted nucleic acid-binding protein
MPDCDDAWWDKARADLFERVGDRRIEVLSTPTRAFEQVMALVSSATLNHNRSLRAWDALHATIASRWSFDVGYPIELITSDRDFDLVPTMMGLGARVTVVNLDIAASTGEGADRNR